jgi:hypothetical protein
MQDMRTQPAIVNISSARAQARNRMRDLAAAARTAAATAADPNGIHPDYPEPVRHGRAWLNGRELGGSDRRYAHLTRAHD